MCLFLTVKSENKHCGKRQGCLFRASKARYLDLQFETPFFLRLF